jgi:tRNA threonylcarbamoyladenosine biosynthesis protein TsaE
VTVHLRSRSPATTETLGRVLGALLAPGDLVRLSGELGAGKTRFVKGVAEGMGAATSTDVVSPTFLRLEEYGPPGRRLRHVDAYRMAGPDDLEALGVSDLLAADGVTVVEWPERVEGALPARGVHIEFLHGGARTRDLRLTGLDVSGLAILHRFCKSPRVRRHLVESM